MIISGTLQLDPQAHAAATASLGDRLADLDARRRAAETAVQALLATWRGDAAAAFREQWEVWGRAATDVVDELGSAVAALTPTASDLVGADELGGAASDHLRGRLGGRLP